VFAPSETRRRPILHAMTEPISGKTVLITGATSGIGLEATVKLAGMGAELCSSGATAGAARPRSPR
jgi:NAD(P)-dependent dehydrogenase (short-subunit alcohol dehydrogenase family)